MTLASPASFGLAASELIGMGSRILPLLSTPTAVVIGGALVGSVLYTEFNKEYNIAPVPDKEGEIQDTTGFWVPDDTPPDPPSEVKPSDLDQHKQVPLSDYNNSLDRLSELDVNDSIYDSLAQHLIDSWQDKFSDDLTLQGKNPDGKTVDLSSLKEDLKASLLASAKSASRAGGGSPPPAVAEKQKIDLAKKAVDEQKKATEATEKANEDSNKCNEDLVAKLDSINDTLKSINDKLKNQNSSSDGDSGNGDNDPDNNDNDPDSDECKCLTKNDWIDVISSAINYDKLALVFARSFTKRVQKNHIAPFHLLKDETQTTALLNNNLAEILEDNITVKDQDGWQDIVIPDEEEIY